MTDLHCTAEVNTALQSNYPSIKKKELPCHYFPLKNPQRFLRNRYSLNEERPVSATFSFKCFRCWGLVELLALRSCTVLAIEPGCMTGSLPQLRNHPQISDVLP